MADVYTVVKPTLVVSKFIGLAPFYVDDEKKAFKQSVPGIIYSAILLLLFAANSAYVMYFKILGKDENGGKNESYISEANDIIQMACGVAVTCCAILLTVIQRNKIIYVVQNFHQVNLEMVKLDIFIPYLSLVRYSQIQIVIILLLVIALLLHDYLSWAFQGNFYGVPHWISYYGPNLYNFIMEYQFISGALLLKRHFTLLNEYLTKFNEPEKDLEEENKKVDISVNNNGWMDNFDSHMGPKVVDQSFKAWDGSFSRFRIRKVAPSEGSEALNRASLAKIKVFRKIHSSLCEIKEALNSSYSLQLLSSVAQAFVIITSNLYLLFTTLNKQDKSKMSFLSYPIVWSLTHVIELVFIVVTCTKTSKMANHTAVVVHKLLAKDCESDIRNQLKLFSIQLLHRKISFTACGFFTLDMTLLQAIIGAATTYLVILIQFHNTYENTPKAN